MKLSNQAIGALMMALQKSLMEQSDIIPVLSEMDFEKSPQVKRWGTKTGGKLNAHTKSHKEGKSSDNAIRRAILSNS